MSRASALLSLQQIDDRIATLTSEIAIDEASLRGDPELDRLRATEAAAHEEHRTLGTTARLAELEAASLQTRIRELDRRLYGGTVRNPAELIEMQRELEMMRAKLVRRRRTTRSSAWSRWIARWRACRAPPPLLPHANRNARQPMEPMRAAACGADRRARRPQRRT